MPYLGAMARLSCAAALGIGQVFAAAVVISPIGFVVPASAQRNCLEINHLVGSGYTRLTNNCDSLISVHWNDQGSCASGCQLNIGPYSKNGATLWRGQVNYCVCFGYSYCC